MSNASLQLPPVTFITTTDQMGVEISLAAPPQRIISLVPSQTELLFDLGLDAEVIGVTKFCVHPENARKTRAVIGGTKKFDLEQIARLNPDLIIGNKEENYEEGILSLRKQYPVWMSDITNLEDAVSMIASVSKLTSREAKGQTIINEINESFGNLGSLPPLKTLYLMWYKPWMGVASSTFIAYIMERMGLQNVLADRERYPELSEEEIFDLQPDLVLLSSEPFPFREKHEQEIKNLLPQCQVLFVDGEMFSWYGSRLRYVAGYTSQLANTLSQR